MQVVVRTRVGVRKVRVLAVPTAHVGAGVVEDFDGEGVEGSEGVVDEVSEAVVRRARSVAAQTVGILGVDVGWEVADACECDSGRAGVTRSSDGGEG